MNERSKEQTGDANQAREWADETLGLSLSAEYWERDGRLADAVRLGIIRSYGKYEGKPVYVHTLLGLQVERCLARVERSCAQERLNRFLSASSQDEAQGILDRWLKEDPDAVLPPPRPFEEITRETATLLEQAALRVALDKAIEEGIVEVGSVRADGEPVYRSLIYDPGDPS